MKNKQIIFKAKLSGDGECGFFEVSKEDYINIFGIDRYNDEIDQIKENNKFTKEDPEYVPIIGDISNYLEDEDPQTFAVYPPSLFEDINKETIKIALSYEVVKGS